MLIVHPVTGCQRSRLAGGALAGGSVSWAWFVCLDCRGLPGGFWAAQPADVGRAIPGQAIGGNRLRGWQCRSRAGAEGARRRALYPRHFELAFVDGAFLDDQRPG